MEGAQEGLMTIHLTLLNGLADASRNSLLGESFGRAILDSACTKNVIGQVRLEEYLPTLTDDE